MGCIRPATPGFVLTTLATALLAVVSFCVPYFKSVYFLKADVSSGGASGTITFGTLGYCLEFGGTTTCSSPSVGYELDINSLVGNNFPVKIPSVVVKWLTYALVLHIVALALAAGSAVFGLLAHIREMAMTCCSTFISGLAAAVAFIAFIFDIALFFLAKARINAVGTASIGNAVWLTLAAWLLLFFSGCFYTLGRCCISNRKKRGDWDKRQDAPLPGANDQMRLDAVKAEADRKARQKASEGGLPAFHESVPLTSTAYDDGHAVYMDKPNAPGGYMQAPPGSRAVDQYYAAGPSAGYNNNATSYPPSPHGQRQYAPSTYAPSTYSYNAPQQSQQTAYPPQQYHSTPPLQHASPPLHSMSPPPQLYNKPTSPVRYNSTPPVQQYAALGAVQAPSAAQRSNPYPDPAANTNPYLGAVQAPSAAQHPNPYLDPAANTNPYLGIPGQGHTAAARGTSYHSAASHTNDYSQYDPYDPTTQNTPHPSEYYTPQAHSQYPEAQHSPQDYTPRSNGYGANSVPPLETGGYFAYASPHSPHSPSPGQSTSSQEPSGSSSPPPKGPRNHRQSLHAMNVDEDSPPEYEVGGGSEHVPGAWGKS
ncbi:SUR7/PalI family-domain-containing protein [Mycena belliarum]|uniref:SUR7/PalI family-domain-containing protein n=1 Tax=Mycena belliarum TaxID=1033014 RepID=A0AAD6TQ32_9AGAR|nr:SUR7/PalI family-domain-containing protein [Mycena belliae]